MISGRLFSSSCSCPPLSPGLQVCERSLSCRVLKNLQPQPLSPHRGGSSPDWSSQSDHRCFVVGCHHLDLSIEVARQPPTSEKFLDVGEAQFHPVLSLDVLHQDGDGDWSFVVEDLLDVFLQGFLVSVPLFLCLQSPVLAPALTYGERVFVSRKVICLAIEASNLEQPLERNHFQKKCGTEHYALQCIDKVGDDTHFPDKKELEKEEGKWMGYCEARAQIR